MQNKLINTLKLSEQLGDGWKSAVLAEMPASKIKLFNVDAGGLSPEVHEEYDEALLVLCGHLELKMADDCIRMGAGDFQLIPAGVWHSIEPGGEGTFLLIDPE